MAWAPLWGHPELLTRSFDWYIDILDEAKKNASRNGYKGARWTKMVSYTGSDCPSKDCTTSCLAAATYNQYVTNSN